MTHTKESIAALLEKNDKAVERGLRIVKNVCGFSFGGFFFGCSLIEQMDNGKSLSKYQLTAARDLLKKYVVVLARVANDNQRLKAQEQKAQSADYAEMKAETENERAYERHLEDRAEMVFNATHGPDIDW